MKNLIILFNIFLVCALDANAQTKKNSISIYTDVELEAENFTYYGLAYERKISTNHGIQLFTGISRQENISIGVEYNYKKQFLADYLAFLAGGGVGLEHHSSESIIGEKNFFLFRPLLGLSFNIPSTNVDIFSTYKPKFDLKLFDTFDVSPILFGIKYNF